jgi:uncharacterized protein YjiS (DUF1127 family)
LRGQLPRWITRARVAARAIRRTLAQWRERARGRGFLSRMSDRQLKDIGLTRLDANREARKFFWRE